MAKISKNLSTVIACWAVALVLVIAGICMGVVIPTFAAADAIVSVSHNGRTEYFTDLTAAAEYASTLTATTETNPAKITLLKDIHTTDEVAFYVGQSEEGVYGAHWVFDLAGHILRSDNGINFGAMILGTLTIIDSNPDVTRYVSRDASGNYALYEKGEKLTGVFADEIKGGVVISPNVGVGVLYGGDKVIINGGNYFGNHGGFYAHGFGVASDEVVEQFEAMFGRFPVCTLVINAGLLQVFDTNYDVDNVAITLGDGGNLEINGGTIYGKVGYVSDEKEDGERELTVINLKNPQNEHVKVNAKMDVTETADGVTVSTATEPYVPENPDVPSTDADAANDNNNMIALIVLGAAAAVMVIGVTVIVATNAKRRKKVA